MNIETTSIIQFKLPTYEMLDMEVANSRNYNLRIIDIKRKLVDTGRLIGNPHRIRLMYKGEELQDNQKLSTLWLKEEPVEVVIRMIGPPEEIRQFSKYDDFVTSVDPKDGTINIPLNVTITIEFGPNEQSNVVFIPGLINSATQPRPINEGNMLDFFHGHIETAAKYGYKQWGSTEHSRLQERVLLIEVDNDIDLHLEQIRYDADGALNYQYDRGDWRSWQRYTHTEPVQCQLSSTFKKDQPTCTLTMQPYSPLKLNQKYAILLCNNVPTIPLTVQESDLYAFIPDGVNEDKLYFFKTEAPSKPKFLTSQSSRNLLS